MVEGAKGTRLVQYGGGVEDGGPHVDAAHVGGRGWIPRAKAGDLTGEVWCGWISSNGVGEVAAAEGLVVGDGQHSMRVWVVGGRGAVAAVAAVEGEGKESRRAHRNNKRSCVWAALRGRDADGRCGTHLEKQRNGELVAEGAEAVGERRMQIAAEESVTSQMLCYPRRRCRQRMHE